MRNYLKLALCIGITTPSLCLNLFAQVVTYQATYTSSDPGFQSAVATLAIDTGSVPSDGTLYSYTGGVLPSWIQSITFDLTTSAATFEMASLDGDISSMSWQNSSSPTLNPTVFYFSGVNSSDYTPAFSITGSSPSTLSISADGTSYTLQQASFSAVPEPEEWAAIASTGLLAFGIWHRRSRKASKA